MRATPNKNLFLSVLIRDREGIIFEGNAEAISSYNDKGPFDVLPLHANFISLLKLGATVLLAGDIPRVIPFERGVLKVREDMVEIYLGILH